jgi:hypothetical protein
LSRSNWSMSPCKQLPEESKARTRARCIRKQSMFNWTMVFDPCTHIQIQSP